MARLLALVSLLAAIASAGCSTVGRLVPYSPALVSPTVKVIELGGLYNVTLLIGAKPVLVDTGPPEAFDDLVKALAAFQPPKGWDESPWLRRHRLVRVAPGEESLEVPGFAIRYDGELGLEVERR